MQTIFLIDELKDSSEYQASFMNGFTKAVKRSPMQKAAKSFNSFLMNNVTKAKRPNLSTSRGYKKLKTNPSIKAMERYNSLMINNVTKAKRPNY